MVQTKSRRRKKAKKLSFEDPQYLSGNALPFYKATHYEFQKKVRAFVDKEIMPFVDKWDEAGTYPMELHTKAYEAGIYGSMWPKEYGGTPPENLDAFCDFIYNDELARCASGGILASAFFSFAIGLPPILNVGSQYLKDLVARDVITGKKILSLAITEPTGGSDVAQIKTTAVKDGDDYIINGEKYFITGGMKSDFYTAGVRTGGPGMGGLSLFLIERNRPGIITSRMKTQGWWASNTAYVIFKNVRVPSKNIIGKLNGGFMPIMENFNHERWALAVQTNRFSRICAAEAAKYARTRTTFGKKLAEHQVIRHKIAEMVRKIDATEAMCENICVAWNQGNHNMAGYIALAKVQATKTCEFCAREASQVFGGRSYIRGGRAGKVERIYREVRVAAIGGGSEEILLDLWTRQAKL